MMKRAIMVMAMAALTLTGTGCFLLHLFIDQDVKIPADHDLKGKRVVVVPMAEGSDGKYFDSELGRNMGGLLAIALHQEMGKQKIPIEILPIDIVEARVKSGVVAHDEFALIGEMLNADVVLVGRILDFHLRNPMIQGYLGTARIEMRVFDASRGGTVYTKTFTHQYPVAMDRGTPMLDPYVSENEFRDMFASYLAKAVSWNFFDKKWPRSARHSWENMEQK